MALWTDYAKFSEAQDFAETLEQRATIKYNPETGRYDVEWYRD